MDAENTLNLVISGRASGYNVTAWDIQIERGDATDYEPYVSETCSVSFGSAGTVYGGTLDVARGLLTVTHGYFQLTSDDVALSGNIVYWPRVLPYAMLRRPGICSHGVVTTNTTVSPRIIIGDGARQVYWIDILNALNLSTLDQFKSWIDTQTVQVVYTLPSPVTYQLTPQQIVALEGVNTVYADCGNVSVTHWPGDGTPVVRYDAAAVTAEQFYAMYNELKAAIAALGGT